MRDLAVAQPFGDGGHGSGSLGVRTYATSKQTQLESKVTLRLAREPGIPLSRVLSMTRQAGWNGLLGSTISGDLFSGVVVPR